MRGEEHPERRLAELVLLTGSIEVRRGLYPKEERISDLCRPVSRVHAHAAILQSGHLRPRQRAAHLRPVIISIYYQILLPSGAGPKRTWTPLAPSPSTSWLALNGCFHVVYELVNIVTSLFSSWSRRRFGWGSRPGSGGPYPSCPRSSSSASMSLRSRRWAADEWSTERRMMGGRRDLTEGSGRGADVVNRGSWVTTAFSFFLLSIRGWADSVIRSVFTGSCNESDSKGRTASIPSS